MADAVEVTIASGLLNRLTSLVFSPVVPIALPNITFVPPVAGDNVAWLRATFLPATSAALGVDYEGTNQHFGIFQVDVFYGQGSGELPPARIATSILGWFKRGFMMTKGGFAVQVTRLPYRKQMIKDDPWMMIPVCIPYTAYAGSA